MIRRREDEDGPSLSELDRLVMRELEALGAPGRRPTRAATRPARDGDAHDPKVVYAHPYAEQRRPQPAEGETFDASDATDSGAEIVDFAMPDQAPEEGLFSADEQNFIKSATDWLRGRPNADLILEAIWSSAVAADADDGEAEAGDDVPAAADTAEAPSSGADGGDDVPDDETDD